MSDVKGWQECEAMGHVGPEADATVHWRDLGLMCDACFGAFGDTRPLQQQLAAAVKELEADLLVWEQLREQMSDTTPLHALLGLRIAAIRATLGGQ
jgi:hypothetical protein